MKSKRKKTKELKYYAINNLEYLTLMFVVLNLFIVCCFGCPSGSQRFN